MHHAGSRSSLGEAEEQLVFIRESNTMLCEESQKVSRKLSEMQSIFQSLMSSTALQTERMNEGDIFFQNVNRFVPMEIKFVANFNECYPMIDSSD